MLRQGGGNPLTGRVDLAVDQLNTHKSAGLVRLVAELCGVPDGLGRKGESGILRDIASRQAFLKDAAHHVREFYMPKHG